MTKFLANVAKIVCAFLGYFEKPHSYVKTAVATSWVTFGKIGVFFNPTSGHTDSSGETQILCSKEMFTIVSVVTKGVFLRSRLFN